MRGMRKTGTSLVVFVRCLSIIAVLALALSPVMMRLSGFDDHGVIMTASGTGPAPFATDADKQGPARACHPGGACMAAVVDWTEAWTEGMETASTRADIGSGFMYGRSAPPMTRPPIA